MPCEYTFLLQEIIVVFVVSRPFASTATANFNLDICLSQFGAYEVFFIARLFIAQVDWT